MTAGAGKGTDTDVTADEVGVGTDDVDVAADEVGVGADAGVGVGVGTGVGADTGNELADDKELILDA